MKIGEFVVENAMTQEELASYLNMTPQGLSKLKKTGWQIRWSNKDERRITGCNLVLYHVRERYYDIPE